MENTNHFTNIAFYKFVDIENPAELREVLLPFCQELNLKGTIILATEGINSCLVGEEEKIDKFIDFMRQDKRFGDIEFKKSDSTHIPFRRMLVKIKKETIPLGMEDIKPAQSTGKYIDAMELKKWYENNEDFVILDTRNDYEVELGTFRNAINPNLDEFRNFPKWVKDNFAQYKKKKVVTFCTGGIRCEKATAFMQNEGFEEVYQVQGGILKYFEETYKNAPNDDNFYDGDCFVFDYRVAVDKHLQQSKYSLCYNCWKTLTPEDKQHEHYREDAHCAYCYESYQKKQASFKQNHKKLQNSQEPNSFSVTP